MSAWASAFAPVVRQDSNDYRSGQLKTSLIGGVLLILAAAIFLILRKRPTIGSEETPWPFYVKKTLTQPEQVLYHRLVAAVPDYIVLSQVQLSRVLGVKKGFNFHEWNNRISQMSLDFLACRKDSTVVAAIELDDNTHRRESRIDTDKRKERALSAAGVALIRWQVGAMPDEGIIRQALVK